MILCFRVDELEPGMILHEDIYDFDNVLMISRGAELTPEQIEAIRRLSVREVSIYRPVDFEQPLTPLQLDPKKVRVFQGRYNKSRDELKDLMRYISDGNQLNLDRIYRIPGSLLDDIGSLNNLFTYLNCIDNLDDHTLGHSVNVALICAVIGKWLNLGKEETKKIVVAGLLHDVGKSKVPPAILNKPGLLTREEWAEIKKHPLYGYQLLKKAKVPDPLLFGALMHHEREDGSGYPLGLKRGKIPMTARYVALADIYDAMTSNRCYRNKICPFQVIDHFQSNYFGVLNTKVLMAFLKRIAECYIGHMVRLNDGRIGKVVFINRREPARPIVQLDDGFINLEDTPDLRIECIHNG